MDNAASNYRLSTVWILLFAVSVFFCGWLLPQTGQAELSEHQLIRRVVVFPAQFDEEFRNLADDVWWQVREELTASRRFLVASKQFLMKSESFQPRGKLDSADVIVLGKLLDAHALVVTRLQNRNFTIVVYEGATGGILWEKTLTLHPSVAISDQLNSAARKLIADFMASVPYQGFQVVDPIIGRPVYEEGDVRLAQIDVGAGASLQVGDMVQWVKVLRAHSEPLYQGGAKIIIFAEGQVVKFENGIATAEVLRIAKSENISEFGLVRIPREYERLQAEYSIKDSLMPQLAAKLMTPETSSMELVRRERRPLVTTLSWVLSVAAMILLAF